MAKNVNDLHLSQVAWLAEHNYARPTGYCKEQKEISELAVLLHTGWNENVGGRPSVRLATEEERAEAVKRLTAQWASLKNMAAEPVTVKIGDSTIFVSNADLCQTFERLYTKDGKIIEPEYMGVTCFRRASSMLLAQTIAAKKETGLSERIPVSVKTYADANGKVDLTAQILDNVEENTQKTAGASNMTNADLCGVSRHLFQLGLNEARLQRAVCKPNQRGMAQKLFALCKLDAAQPDLKIIDRVMQGAVKFGPLDAGEMRKLVEEGASKDEVAGYVANPKEQKNAKKIMNRAGIQRLKEQNPCTLVQRVAQAILNDNGSELADITLHAKEINAAVEGILNPVPTTK